MCVNVQNKKENIQMIVSLAELFSNVKCFGFLH